MDRERRKNRLRLVTQDEHGTMPLVYGRMFILARESRGHTRREAAQQSGVPLERLRAIERDEQAPSRVELDDLSVFYHYPDAFFCQGDDYYNAFSDPGLFLCGPWLDEAKPCAICGLKALSSWLCDWPMGKGKTCDIVLCDTHRRRVAGEPDEDDDPEGVDYCPAHAAESRAAAWASLT